MGERYDSFTTTYGLSRDPRSIKPRVTSISGACAACGLTPNTSFVYGNGTHPLLEMRMTNGRGFHTDSTYNAVGLVLTRKEAVGAAEERLTSYEYNEANFPGLLTAIQVPSTTSGFRRTEMDYNNTSGLLETRSIEGKETGAPALFLPPTGLVTNFTNNGPTGELRFVNPPDDGSFGTADQTEFTYIAGRIGVANQRIDPIVGATTFGYDALNRRTSVTDPNAVVTTTAYDELGRVKETHHVGASPPADDLVTKYFYDCPLGPPGVEPAPGDPPACRLFGDLRCVQLPMGNAIEYRYDAMGRLTAVTRKTDCSDATQPLERTLYTLDRLGNRTLEELQRWSGSAWLTDSRTESVYSSRCHIDKVVRGKGSGAATESTTEYCYDANNNLEKIWDANHASATFPLGFTRHEYDSRDRLIRMTLPWGPTAGACDPNSGTDADCSTTKYEYDVQDHLKKVIDAEGNETLYETGDRDLMTKETSVSVYSGGTPFRVFAYNEHGELKTETDPRGITVTRTLDALDRVTLIDYPDATLDTAYDYDGPGSSLTPFQIGRLREINRGTGASVIAYDYDRFGRMTQDGGLVYRYDKNGNRTEVRYPAGAENVAACTTYDFADLQKTMSYSLTGGSTPCASGTVALVTDASYLASGPLGTLSLANGVVETRSHDQRYYPTAITAGSLLTWAYTTDKIGNPTAIDDQLASNQDRAYGYQDHQYFLTTGNGPWGNQSWTYDRIGNRKTETDNTTPAALAHAYTLNALGKDSPRLATITPAPGNAANGVRTYGYDAAGNQTTITDSGGELSGTDTFAYSAESRLSSLSSTYGKAQSILLYDGRGFLRQSDLGYINAPDTLRAEPTYSSDGLLLRRRSLRVRQRSHPDTGGGVPPVTTDKTATVFYFAGRPVAQRNVVVGGPTDTLYLTTDHLGAPILATSGAGAELWKGGFRPFGGTYTFLEGTELFLRFPGQWDDPSWKTSGRTAGLYQNVHRWYQSGIGRYDRPDPLGLEGGSHLLAYADSNPITTFDPLGLQTAAAVELGCSLMRSRNTIGVVAGVVVIVGGAALSGDCDNRRCGSCSPPEHAFLQSMIAVFCSGERRCDPGQDLWTLQTNRHRNVNCAIARSRINKRCFGGGDEGHQRAEAEAWTAAGNCEALLRGWQSIVRR